MRRQIGPFHWPGCFWPLRCLNIYERQNVTNADPFKRIACSPTQPSLVQRKYKPFLRNFVFPVRVLYKDWHGQEENYGAFDQFLAMHVSEFANCLSAIVANKRPYFEWDCFASASQQQASYITELNAKVVCKDDTVQCVRCGSNAVSKQLVQDWDFFCEANPTQQPKKIPTRWRRDAKRVKSLHELSQITIHSLLTQGRV